MKNYPITKFIKIDECLFVGVHIVSSKYPASGLALDLLYKYKKQKLRVLPWNCVIVSRF